MKHYRSVEELSEMIGDDIYLITKEPNEKEYIGRMRDEFLKYTYIFDEDFHNTIIEKYNPSNKTVNIIIMPCLIRLCNDIINEKYKPDKKDFSLREESFNRLQEYAGYLKHCFLNYYSSLSHLKFIDSQAEMVAQTVNNYYFMLTNKKELDDSIKRDIKLEFLLNTEDL